MLARTLDALVALALAWALPPLGAALALTYVLVADAIWPGQSPGKRVFGVTVIRIPGGHGGTLWTSVARNLPMAVALLLLLLPLVSLVVFPVMGIPLLLWERHLTRTGTRGQRLGDILGDCYVADIWRAPPRPRAT
jgi:uncharacterized RDD family membrane protein YckC